MVKTRTHRGASVMRSNEGVTPVMANVLMVAVLVLVSIGVYALLSQFEDASPSPDRRQGSFTVDRGPYNREFRILYVSGGPIPLADGVLQATVDGTPTEHSLEELAAQTADGANWVVGERFCVVGADAACLYGSASSVDVVLLVGEDVMFHAKRDLNAA